jgi:hypothetical protein
LPWRALSRLLSWSDRHDNRQISEQLYHESDFGQTTPRSGPAQGAATLRRSASIDSGRTSAGNNEMPPALMKPARWQPLQQHHRNQSKFRIFMTENS